MKNEKSANDAVISILVACIKIKEETFHWLSFCCWFECAFSVCNVLVRFACSKSMRIPLANP